MVAFAEEKEAAPPQPPRLSREDYLVWESQQEAKHEYHDGCIIEMAGAGLRHIRINANLNRIIGIQLDEEACELMTGDMRIYAPECSAYFYADASIVCEEPELEIIRRIESLLNPLVIIEVLSKSTEKSDRADKFHCYKTLDSLQTYVLVSQDTPRIEVFERQAAEEWTETVSAGIEATARLERIGCELTLRSVYARLTFDEAESE